MPRKKTTPPRRVNYRKLLEESVEREAQWKVRLEATEQALEVSNDLAVKERRELCDEIEEARNGRRAYRRTVGITNSQLTALRLHIDALAQRYAGVKLDTQQFTFAQATEWLKTERAAIEQTLNRVVLDAAQRAESQQEAA